MYYNNTIKLLDFILNETVKELDDYKINFYNIKGIRRLLLVKLYSHIAGISFKEIAQNLNISEEILTRKILMIGEYELFAFELYKIKEMLNLTNQESINIFFKGLENE